SNPADVRVEHPCDTGGGGPGEREHVLPPVLAAPGVAARRPRLVDRSVSRSDGYSGDGWPDPTHDADRRPRVLFLERERRPGLAFAALQSESVRRLPARASVLAGLLHILVFLAVFIGGSVMFAKFWIMTTNMGPEDVARQIES